MTSVRLLPFAALLSLSCAQSSQPPTSSAPIPALSAVSEETKTPTADPAPEETPSPALTLDECRSQPGEVLTDKGDGKLHEEGCPDGRQKLGVVRVGIENGLCCAPSAAAATPPAEAAPAGKRPPCTNDQSCNADERVSALWGKCTALGVCECKPGFELNPLGRCQKPVK